MIPSPRFHGAARAAQHIVSGSRVVARRLRTGCRRLRRPPDRKHGRRRDHARIAGLVIDGEPSGSRARRLCAVTHNASHPSANVIDHIQLVSRARTRRCNATHDEVQRWRTRFTHRIKMAIAYVSIVHRIPLNGSPRR